MSPGRQVGQPWNAAAANCPRFGPDNPPISCIVTVSLSAETKWHQIQPVFTGFTGFMGITAKARGPVAWSYVWRLGKRPAPFL